MSQTSSTDNAKANDYVSHVPVNVRPWVLTAAVLHLSVVAICLFSSHRLSNLAIDLLGFISPYATTLNLRMDLQPLAVTDVELLETPIAVRFRNSKPTADSQWIDWASSSRTVDGTYSSSIRRQRYLRQLEGLLTIESSDGISQLIAAMLNDIQSKPGASEVDQFQIVQLPIVQSNEWEIAEKFRREGNLPTALQPEVLLAANIVRLEDGSIGVLPEISELRTAPVIENATTNSN